MAGNSGSRVQPRLNAEEKNIIGTCHTGKPRIQGTSFN